MTDFSDSSEYDLKRQMMIEALEYYIHKLKEDNCNQVAIDAFTDLLSEFEYYEQVLRNLQSIDT